MNFVISILAVVVVCFATNVRNKAKELKDSGASGVELNLLNGSLCGTVDGVKTCKSIYIIKNKGNNRDFKN